MKKGLLRSGYTTGACAAASTKAATLLLLRAKHNAAPERAEIISPAALDFITISLPDGENASFKINKSGLATKGPELSASASIIKFAGDDPDVTNGAEITACVTIKGYDFQISNPAFETYFCRKGRAEIIIKRGSGVGIVTKPGLPVPVGSPAINPVPLKMIRDAVIGALNDSGCFENNIQQIDVSISVTDGEKIALKTLNPRLGIKEGISILGTTGIVKPLSSEAWTATISTSMDVAIATGCSEIVLSAGRASEKVHMKKYKLPEESYVMMGDYLEFSLLEAKRHRFKRIHLCAQWAKMLKIAMSTPQTHVRYGAIDIKRAIAFLNQNGIILPEKLEFNTAREIFQMITSTSQEPLSAFSDVCRHAKKYSEMITGGVPVNCYLISYEGEIILKV